MVTSKEELDEIFGIIDRVELNESTVVDVEQRDDEITFAIAGIVCVNFDLSPDQALKLSRALATAAENASKFLEETGL
jgi:hypothetical protein